MTSTIRVNQVEPAGGGTPRNLPRGVAAAWVNYKGTATTEIRDSENISSAVDVSTGTHEYFFINNMVNTNYSTVGSSGDGGGNLIVGNVRQVNYFRTRADIATTGGQFNAVYNDAAVFGSLA